VDGNYGEALILLNIARENVERMLFLSFSLSIFLPASKATRGEI